MQKFSLIQLYTVALLALGIVSVPAAANTDIASWKKAVVKQISKKQKYPRSAQVREIEGRAVIRINVNSDGTITSHEIVKSTGASILDREIPKLVKRLNPLPALPAGTPNASLQLPLDWSLN